MAEELSAKHKSTCTHSDEGTDLNFPRNSSFFHFEEENNSRDDIKKTSTNFEKLEPAKDEICRYVNISLIKAELNDDENSIEQDCSSNLSVGNQSDEVEGEGLEDLPVKTELASSEDEADTSDLTESDNTITSIKVEPLEENYIDRTNDFIQAITSEHVYATDADDDESIDQLQTEAGKGHFLIQIRPEGEETSSSLTCPSCSARFKYQSTYDYHVKSQCGSKMIAEADKLVRKAKNQSFACNVCGKQVCSRTSLMVHMRIHNGERPFACTICSRAFFQKAHLKDHMKIHTKAKHNQNLVITCSECGQMFSHKKFLTSHMRVHFGDKVFDCSVCHKRFRTRSNLNNHKMIHSETKDFPCTLCDKAFFRKPSLEDHMRVHTKEKPWACEICGKRFADKGRRNTHFKRHTGELKQVCPICNKKFACSYDLRVHQRKHTGEKPFSCNICGRMFNRKAIMETHMTIHTGRKDFVCSQCGEAFNRKSKLDVHLADHSGERFSCEVCHKVFKCKAYLVPHLRNHFGEGKKRVRVKKSICLLCHKTFTSAEFLQEHLVKAHESVFKHPSVMPSDDKFVKVESDDKIVKIETIDIVG